MNQLKVLVLGGGPDKEREVSLNSARAVAQGLRDAGHVVFEGDVLPEDTRALDIECDVVFPMIHGKFGEGGPLQRLLEQKGLKYVGSNVRASSIAIDKAASKKVVSQVGIATPESEVVGPNKPIRIDAPLVLKPLTEGSSVGVMIARHECEVAEMREKLHKDHAYIMAERFVTGREMTVGVIGGEALPVIEIVPCDKEKFYDYDAKYIRNDTGYHFDTTSDNLSGLLQDLAVKAFNEIGCRHLGRVDFMVDGDDKPWFIEINTLPGFTDHSLLPMAAGRAGISMKDLCDQLVKMAMD